MTHILYTGTRPLKALPGALTITHVPLLEVRALDLCAGELPDLLHTHPQATLVIYSHHALSALAQSGLAAHREMTMWCVGAKTRARAALLFPHARVHAPPADAQDFTGLSGALAGRPEGQGVCIALTLDGAPRPLALALAQGGGQVFDVPAYQTHAIKNLPPSLHSAAQLARMQWIALTSSRGALAWHQLVSALADDGARHAAHGIRRAAIGESTALACEQLGMPCHHVASAPNVEILLGELARSGVKP